MERNSLRSKREMFTVSYFFEEAFANAPGCKRGIHQR